MQGIIPIGFMILVSMPILVVSTFIIRTMVINMMIWHMASIELEKLRRSLILVNLVSTD